MTLSNVVLLSLSHWSSVILESSFTFDGTFQIDVELETRRENSKAEHHAANRYDAAAAGIASSAGSRDNWKVSQNIETYLRSIDFLPPCPRRCNSNFTLRDTAIELLNPSSDSFPPFSNLNFCEVNIHLTHFDASDDVLARVWLPSARDDWNSRFQATGGGGFATSIGFVGLAPAILQGYAAVSTDGGHDEWSWTSLEWVLNSDRSINWDLWQNSIQRSVVKQIIIGKDIVEHYYGEQPHYSYWNGCSQGGRQGYMLAQRFSDILDGIMAAAPALNLVSIPMGGLWSQLVIKDINTYMSQCEFAYFTKKAMEECDPLDSFEDGVIIDPGDCKSDSERLIGNAFECDGRIVRVTTAMADVVRKIRDGPRSPLGLRT